MAHTVFARGLMLLIVVACLGMLGGGCDGNETCDFTTTSRAEVLATDQQAADELVANLEFDGVDVQLATVFWVYMIDAEETGVIDENFLKSGVTQILAERAAQKFPELVSTQCSPGDIPVVPQNHEPPGINNCKCGEGGFANVRDCLPRAKDALNFIVDGVLTGLNLKGIRALDNGDTVRDAVQTLKGAFAYTAETVAGKVKGATDLSMKMAENVDSEKGWLILGAVGAVTGLAATAAAGAGAASAVPLGVAATAISVVQLARAGNQLASDYVACRNCQARKCSEPDEPIGTCNVEGQASCTVLCNSAASKAGDYCAAQGGTLRSANVSQCVTSCDCILAACPELKVCFSDPTCPQCQSGCEAAMSCPQWLIECNIPQN